jgi:RNA polymerase sigma-70 factor (ECF subfamily)
MEVHDKIAQLIPRLRRYARALASAGKPPDELVRRTLERASQEVRVTHIEADLRVWLFTLLHEIYVQEVAAQDAEGLPAQPPRAANGALPFEHAIATLSPQQREIFLLVTLEDMSYDQVAKTLGIPIGTVMSRLSRAREKLRLLLMDQARVRVVK